ncbi:3-methyladenine DNA glycosylase [Candidatus Termititenax persephonae]|uniref:Putative 3-methyladenine DNA glycosylase n=1 Tax=Candidatus Termititenax persephonae TaxID=2218525 RepID=A0A388TEI5_9BACT|nr:3-methyladenine DNA glycosylase [Candidatus Termititenax persephonae]
MLSARFFQRSTTELARELLGKYLVYGRLWGKIVETEAYLYHGDPGCHAHRGLTPRNAPMFGPAGRTYVYLIYGMYYCLNIVSGKVGEGEAVLIRALEPVKGLEIMQKNRRTLKIENLCSGPGKLTQAFGLTKKHNNLSLQKGPLHIYDNQEKPVILTSTRIGLNVGKELPLRFFIQGNRFVSNYRPATEYRPRQINAFAKQAIKLKNH